MYIDYIYFHTLSTMTSDKSSKSDPIMVSLASLKPAILLYMQVFEHFACNLWSHCLSTAPATAYHQVKASTGAYWCTFDAGEW